MTARLTIEYDGSGFHGWAAQPGLRTVQGELERALRVATRGDTDGGEPVITVAGRTDRGVHALAQVASHPGEPIPVARWNALLPDDVAVSSSVAAPDDFDARHDCTSRAYCYRCLIRDARPALASGRALHLRSAVDVEALRECARMLVGTHDFTAFTPTETYHVRFEREVFRAFWRAEGGAFGSDGIDGVCGEAGGQSLEFWIEADSFMRHMNRVLIGTMLQVARGQRSLESFAALLTGRPRAEAGPTAPAHGLYFAGAGYEGRRLLTPSVPAEG